jgi:hypothetical protein
MPLCDGRDLPGSGGSAMNVEKRPTSGNGSTAGSGQQRPSPPMRDTVPHVLHATLHDTL